MSSQPLGEVEEARGSPRPSRRRGEGVERLRPSRRRSACRSSVEPSSKNDRHCGSSGIRSSSSSQSRPASAKMRRSTDGMREDRRPHVEAVAVGLQDRRLAAQPGVFSKSDDRVAARRQRAGRRQPAQSAADHADPSGLVVASSLSSRRIASDAAGQRSVRFDRVIGRAIAAPRRHLPRHDAIGRAAGPESCSSSRDVIRADSKITGSPLPGCVPPPTR